MPLQQKTLSRTTTSGIALAGVLWAVMLLSLIALTVVGIGRSGRATVDAHIRRAQVDALLDAGLNRLILGLLTANSTNEWRADGKPRDFVFAGTKLQLIAWPEAGKVDINNAAASSLATLFQAAGAHPGQADTLARTVVERRADGVRLFHTVNDIRHLPGMTPSLYCKVASSLTVFSQQAAIDPAAAPVLVQQAFAAGEHALPTEEDNGKLARGGSAFTLRAELAAAEARRFRLPPQAKELVIRFTENPRMPFWRLGFRDTWQQDPECALP